MRALDAVNSAAAVTLARVRKRPLRRLAASARVHLSAGDRERGERWTPPLAIRLSAYPSPVPLIHTHTHTTHTERTDGRSVGYFGQNHRVHNALWVGDEAAHARVVANGRSLSAVNGGESSESGIDSPTTTGRAERVMFCVDNIVGSKRCVHNAKKDERRGRGSGEGEEKGRRREERAGSLRRPLRGLRWDQRSRRRGSTGACRDERRAPAHRSR